MAALVFAGAAFPLQVPSSELLLSFFRERLAPAHEWHGISTGYVIIDGDSISLPPESLTVGDTDSPSESFKGNPFALTAHDLMLPIDLARSEFDSVAVNKTRTRFCDVMCWKMKLFIDDRRFDVLVSGDGIFRVMKMDYKPRGSAKSRDVWLFVEVEKGKDIPVLMTRSVRFEWGGKMVSLISTREFVGPKPVIGLKPIIGIGR